MHEGRCVGSLNYGGQFGVLSHGDGLGTITIIVWPQVHRDGQQWRPMCLHIINYASFPSYDVYKSSRIDCTDCTGVYRRVPAPNRQCTGFVSSKERWCVYYHMVRRIYSDPRHLVFRTIHTKKTFFQRFSKCCKCPIKR